MESVAIVKKGDLEKGLLSMMGRKACFACEKEFGRSLWRYGVLFLLYISLMGSVVSTCTAFVSCKFAKYLVDGVAYCALVM